MESKAYRTYLEEEKAWLADYALYMAVKDSFDGKSWDQWEEHQAAKPEAIAAYKGTIKMQRLIFINFCSMCSPDSGPD